MALRAPVLLFVRRAASPQFNALTTQFHQILVSVANMQARCVVVALDANPILRGRIEAACIGRGVPLFRVPSQDELRNAADANVRVEFCAIVGADHHEDFMVTWIDMLTAISQLEIQLGYHPNV